MNLTGNQVPYKVKNAVEQSAGLLSRFDFNIRSNSSAAVDRSTQISAQAVAVLRADSTMFFSIEIIVVERNVRVIPLNGPSCRRVIPGSSKHQTGSSPHRENALNQSFTKRIVADYQRAVVILQSSGNNL